MKTLKSKIISYVIILVSIGIIAGVGSLLVNLGMDWYMSLDKPIQFVPSFLIPIVWTVIYIVFAIVLCLLSNDAVLNAKTITLLTISGILNIIWCLLFFALNLTFWGLVSIVLLLISSYLVVLDLLKYNKFYVFFTIIYPIWVSIATTLNIALWILN